jgi:hypothetical protein
MLSTMSRCPDYFQNFQNGQEEEEETEQTQYVSQTLFGGHNKYRIIPTKQYSGRYSHLYCVKYFFVL